jgi:TolA-binding protein
MQRNHGLRIAIVSFLTSMACLLTSVAVNAASPTPSSSPPSSLAQAKQQQQSLQELIATAKAHQSTLESQLQSEQLKVAQERRYVKNQLLALAEVVTGEYMVVPEGSELAIIASPNIQTAIDTQIVLSNLSQSQTQELHHLEDTLREMKYQEDAIRRQTIAAQNLTAKLTAEEMVASIQVAEIEAQQQAAAKEAAQQAAAAAAAAAKQSTPTPKPAPIPTPIPIPTPGTPTPAGSDNPFTISTNLTQPSGITLQQIQVFLQGTPLEADANYFLQAEVTNHVSAIYLVADAVLETGFGTSQIYLQKHNLFGFEAYTSDPNAAMSFPSDQACISFVSWYVSVNYLTPPGSLVPPYGSSPGTAPSVPTGLYYNGPTLAGMNVDYATDPAWADKLAVLGDELQLIQTSPSSPSPTPSSSPTVTPTPSS